MGLQAVGLAGRPLPVGRGAAVLPAGEMRGEKEHGTLSEGRSGVRTYRRGLGFVDVHVL